MEIFLVLLGLAAVVGIYLWITYNALVALKVRVDEAWSDITVQLKRRADLIPNLIETVRGYASHEREVFESVTRARAATVSPDALAHPAQAAEAEGMLQGALKSLFAVSEAYPQLVASTNFLELQRELTDTEDKIMASRRFYNGGVSELNTKIQQFPNNVFARNLGFTNREFFEVENPIGNPRATAGQVLRMYRAIAANKRNTVIIIGLFVGLLTALAVWWGQATGNGSSAIFIVLFILGYTVFQYYLASKFAISMSGAHEIQKQDNPRLWNIVENLAITEGLPMPKVYIINDPAPNAFATGRNPKNAVVAATTGLLEIMDDNELQGVMAHELGHVKNFDIRVSTIVFGLVSAIGILADLAIRMAWFGSSSRNRDSGQLGIILVLVGVVGWIIAWLIGPLVSAAVSRQREYLADATGAEMTRYPHGLASALQKLGEYGRPMRRANSAMAHMYINDPLKPGMVERVFSTHPPIPDRIRRLAEISRGF